MFGLTEGKMKQLINSALGLSFLCAGDAPSSLMIRALHRGVQALLAISIVDCRKMYIIGNCKDTRIKIASSLALP